MTALFFGESDRAGHMNAVLNAVKTAKEEVLAITWPTSDDDQSAELDEARRVYFDVLLDKCRNDGLRYRRVLQLSQPASFAEIRRNYDPLYVEHFEAMLKMSAEHGGDAVELLIAPLTIPGTFVFIDRSYFAWEICERDPDGNGWRSRYALQVSEVSGSAFASLAQAFETTLPAAAARALDVADLRAG